MPAHLATSAPRIGASRLPPGVHHPPAILKCHNDCRVIVRSRVTALASSPLGVVPIEPGYCVRQASKISDFMALDGSRLCTTCVFVIALRFAIEQGDSKNFHPPAQTCRHAGPFR